MKLRLHGERLCAPLVCLALAVASGCGGAAAPTQRAVEGAANVDGKSSTAASERATSPRYVVIHRDQPLYLAPNDAAEFVQFLSAQETAQIERARLAQLEAEREAAELAKRREAERQAKVAAQKKKQKPKKKKKKKARKLTRAQREALAKAEQERKAKELKRQAARFVAAQEREQRARPYAHPQQRYHVMRVIRALDSGWLEVESLERSEQAQHCWRESLPELEGAKLRFFVQPEQLSQVIVRLERFEFDSGVQVKLQPGVVVTERQGDQTTVWADGVSVRLDVPADAVDAGYKAPQLFESPETDAAISDVAFMRDELKIDKKQRLPFVSFFEQFVVETGQAKRSFYLTRQTPCAEFRVLAKPEHVEPLTKRRVTRIRGGHEEAKPPYVRAGATLWDMDGRQVGQAVEALSLVGAQAIEGSHGRACYALKLWSKLPAASWRVLKLCVEEGAVQAL